MNIVLQLSSDVIVLFRVGIFRLAFYVLGHSLSFERKKYRSGRIDSRIVYS